MTCEIILLLFKLLFLFILYSYLCFTKLEFEPNLGLALKLLFYFFVGLAKILKKYDKRTGRLLRLPFIKKVVQQPFFMTEAISKLVKECENTIDSVLPMPGKKVMRKDIRVGVEGIFRNTVAALLSMEEIRRGSSTYSHFSLPPLNLPDSDLIHSFQLKSPIPII